MTHFQLLDQLTEVYYLLEGKTVSADQIIKALNKSFRTSHLKFSYIKTLALSNNTLPVSGCYDPNLDIRKRKPIEIEIIFPKAKKKFKLGEEDFSRDEWTNLSHELAVVIGHELIHLKQSRKRKFQNNRPFKSAATIKEVKQYQEYLGDNDEIEAYAFTAAAHQIRTLPMRYALNDNLTYHIYRDLFGKNHPVVKKFKSFNKKFYQQLKREYHGRYRSK